MAIYRGLSSSSWIFVLLATSGIRFTCSSPDPHSPTRGSDASGASSADKSTSKLKAPATSLALSTAGDMPRSSPQAVNVPGTSSGDSTFMPSDIPEDLRLLSMENVDLSTSDAPGSSTEDEWKPKCIFSVDDISEYSSSLLSGMTKFPSVKFEDGSIYRLEFEEPLPDDAVMNTLREEVHETPENMARAGNELAERLRNDKELHVPWHNAAWLTRFLRARKYDVKKTFALIRKYYEFREKNSYIYDYDAASRAVVLDALEQKVIAIMPRRDKHGRRVSIIRAEKWNPEKYPLDKICIMAVMLAEVGAYEPKTQLAGVLSILDLKGLNWAQVFNLVESLFVATKMAGWVQNCVPLRVEGIHVVNEPKWFWKAYRLVRHVLTKELIAVLKVHGTNWTVLQEMIGEDNLPAAYGGKIKANYAVPADIWESLLEYQEREDAEKKLYGIRKEKSSPSWGKMLRWKTRSTGS